MTTTVSPALLKSWIAEGERLKRELAALAALIGFQCARKGASATETIGHIRRIFDPPKGEAP